MRQKTDNNDVYLPSEPTFSHFRDKCVCCEQSGKKMNKEHIFPQWLLRRTKTQNDIVSSPYGKISAGKLTAPLCEDCNSELGQILEIPVSKVFDSIESGIGFNDYEAELLIRWMWKITGLFYCSICNEHWKYGVCSLKERVLSPISFARSRLSIAVSLIEDAFEDYGCAPIGLDAFSFFSNVYAAGVFSKICLAIIYSEYEWLIDNKKWTVYRLSDVPNVLNQKIRIVPKVGFDTGSNAISYVKKYFGNDSLLYKKHEESAYSLWEKIK